MPPTDAPGGACGAAARCPYRLAGASVVRASAAAADSRGASTGRARAARSSPARAAAARPSGGFLMRHGHVAHLQAADLERIDAADLRPRIPASPTPAVCIAADRARRRGAAPRRREMHGLFRAGVEDELLRRRRSRAPAPSPCRRRCGRAPSRRRSGAPTRCETAGVRLERSQEPDLGPGPGRFLAALAVRQERRRSCVSAAAASSKRCMPLVDRRRACGGIPVRAARSSDRALHVGERVVQAAPGGERSGAAVAGARLIGILLEGTPRRPPPLPRSGPNDHSASPCDAAASGLDGCAPRQIGRGLVARIETRRCGAARARARRRHRSRRPHRRCRRRGDRRRAHRRSGLRRTTDRRLHLRRRPRAACGGRASARLLRAFGAERDRGHERDGRGDDHERARLHRGSPTARATSDSTASSSG